MSAEPKEPISTASLKLPCQELKAALKPAGLKNTLHTNNLLSIGHNTIAKDALSTSGFKNNELLTSLKYLQKTTKKSSKKFDHLKVDFSDPQNENNLINVDFTKITKKNPLTVSLKLFLSKTTCPHSIKKYIDIFHKIYIDTIEKAEYASREECLEKIKKQQELQKMQNAKKRHESSESGFADTSSTSIQTTTNISPRKQPLEQPESLDPCSKYKIDMLILSLSKDLDRVDLEEKNSSIKDYIYKFYEKLEDLHDSGRVQNIGLSDLSSEMVADLEKQARIQPSVLQVKYTSMNNCDSEIRNLMKYSEENDVLLLRHSDEIPFLTSEKLNEIAEEEEPGEIEIIEGENVLDKDENQKEIQISQITQDQKPERIESIDAVLRYTLTSKWHSVLLAKGYFIFEN